MSKCWYCNEELTTANYCDEHIGICTKCYGSMFQVSNEFVKGLMDKIADLEAKLAEKDRAIENWQTMYQSVMQSCHNGIEEDKRLREQLAEWERDSNATLNEYRAIKYENKQLNKALELAVQQLDDAKDMLRECGKQDWANTLDTSADYFKSRAKEMKDE